MAKWKTLIGHEWWLSKRTGSSALVPLGSLFVRYSKHFILRPIREELPHIFLLEQMLQRRLHNAGTNMRIALFVKLP